MQIVTSRWYTKKHDWDSEEDMEAQQGQNHNRNADLLYEDNISMKHKTISYGHKCLKKGLQNTLQKCMCEWV